jgi:hypothetical protein
VRPENRCENHRLQLRIVSTLARSQIGAQPDECENHKEKQVPHVHPLSWVYTDCLKRMIPLNEAKVKEAETSRFEDA